MPKHDEGGQQNAIRLISEAYAKSQVPSFKKVYPLEIHGGATSPKKRTGESVRGKRDPVRHVTESENMKFPLGEKAHQPRDVEGAAREEISGEINRRSWIRGYPA